MQACCGSHEQETLDEHNERRSLAARSNTTVVIITETSYYDVLQNDTPVLTPEVAARLSSFDTYNPNTPFEELLAELNKTIGPDLDLHTGHSTWLRGMWPTDSNGMMEMKTVFPGFYVERTIHIHAQVHNNWVLRANRTIASDNTSSTGQMFFAEGLSEQVMALEPFSTRTEIDRTTNAVDSIFAGETVNGWDPTMAAAPLDRFDVTKGMVAYLNLGVSAWEV